MSRNSYSDVVKGARKAPGRQPKSTPQIEATLAWEPSPASPSPPRRSSARLPPPKLSAFPSLHGGIEPGDGQPEFCKPLVSMSRSWAAATKGTFSKAFIPIETTIDDQINTHKISLSTDSHTFYRSKYMLIPLLKNDTGPPKLADPYQDVHIVTAETPGKMASPVRGRQREPHRGSLEQRNDCKTPGQSSSLTAEPRSDIWIPKAE